MSASAGVISAPAGLAGVPAMLGLRHLRFVLVGRRIRLGDGAFVVAILATLTAMLGTLLFLNTSLAEQSFQLTKIRQDMRELTVREQVLSSELAAAESPIGLQEKARALGMVAAGSPIFLRIADGKILGEDSPAVAPEVFLSNDAVAPPVGGETIIGFVSKDELASSAAAASAEGGVEGAAIPGSSTASATGESESATTSGESALRPIGMVPGGSR